MKTVLFAGRSSSLLRFNSELIEEIVKNGHTVECIASDNECEEDLKKLGASYTRIEFSRSSINPFKGLSVIAKLTKFFKEKQFDAYYGFTAAPATYGVMAAKKAGIKHIFVAITGAGKIVQKREGLFNKFIRVVLSNLYRTAIKSCEKVFFLNDDNIDYFIKYRIVKACQCVKIGGTGVNTAKFIEAPIPTKNYFLFVGALLKFKGIMEYMQAARLVKKEYPDAEFHVVGAIDDRLSAITQEELNEYVNDGSIIYEGFQSDVRPFIENCRYFVLPSYSEGIPTCVLEAMATKRAIITTYAPGCRETVIDGKNGILVPIKDVQALKDAMIHLIEHPDEVEKMAENSLSIVREKFDVSVVNRVIIDTMDLNCLGTGEQV